MKADNDSKPRSKAACTTCGGPQVEGFAPFCSKRCADVDLGRWFKGSYAVPGEPLHVIEVQSGDYLGEDDIERFDDVYGRS